MKRLLIWLDLARAHSAAGAGLAVWVGGRLAGASWEAWWLAPMAVAVLLSAAGNALNDAHDAAADAVSRPRRPIPRGDATPTEARHLAMGCAALALLLALPFGILSTLGSLLAIAIIRIYSRHLKPIPLLGNLVVGGLAGMALGYGGLLAGNVPAILLPGAALALLFGAREVLKTIPDITGDRAMSVRTATTEWGQRGALLVTALGFAVALLLLALWARGQPLRWLGVALLAALSVALLLPVALRPASPRALLWAIGGSKALGLVGLAVMAVAR